MIKNELIKIFKKKTFYFIILLIFGFGLLFNILSLRAEKRKSKKRFNLMYFEVQDIEFSAKDCKNSKDRKEEDKYCPYYIKAGEMLKKLDKNFQKAILVQEYKEEITEAILMKEDKKLNEILNYLQGLESSENFVEEKLKKIDGALKAPMKEAEKENLLQQKEILEYRLKNKIEYDASFKDDLLASYQTNKEIYNTSKNKKDYNEEELALLEKKYKLAKYKLDNFKNRDPDSIKYIPENVRTLQKGLNFFIFLSVVIFASAIFSEEFQKGTVKDLLIKPFTRTEIYFSKIAAIFITIFLTMIAYILITYLLAIIFGDIKTLTMSSYVYNFNTKEVMSLNSLSYSLKYQLASIPNYLLLASIAILVAMISESNAIAVGFVFVENMFEPLLIYLVGQERKIVNVFPQAHMPLGDYFYGGVPDYILKVGKLSTSLLIVFGYIIILNLISLIIFKKKDIKNV